MNHFWSSSRDGENNIHGIRTFRIFYGSTGGTGT
jgi:hypothetical protein